MNTEYEEEISLNYEKSLSISDNLSNIALNINKEDYNTFYESQTHMNNVIIEDQKKEVENIEIIIEVKDDSALQNNESTQNNSYDLINYQNMVYNQTTYPNETNNNLAFFQFFFLDPFLGDLICLACVMFLLIGIIMFYVFYPSLKVNFGIFAFMSILLYVSEGCIHKKEGIRVNSCYEFLHIFIKMAFVLTFVVFCINMTRFLHKTGTTLN